jgi:hypothetical protein
LPELPAGAFHGNGTTCPAGCTIEGDALSDIYRPPLPRVYAQTGAELSFA